MSQNQIDGYKYIGCYKDSKNDRALKNMIGRGSLNQCINMGKLKGYDTIGLQYTDECWAGDNNQDGNDYKKHGLQTNNEFCNINKPGSLTNIIYQNLNIINPIQSVLPTSKLSIGQKISIGQILYSDNREYYLILQSDGNLCIYNDKDQRIWETKTNGRKSSVLIMQSDGNLCIYSNPDNTGGIWCSMSNGKNASIASIDNDGVLRIYDKINQIVWESSKSNVLPEFILPIPKNMKEVDYDYDSNTEPIFVIGNYGIAPWGNTNFPDKTAQWIWYSPLSNINSPNNSNIPMTLQYIWENKSHIQIEGVLNIMVDNYADVFLNKKQIGSTISGGWSGNNNWPKINFIAEPGSNLFEFKVKNMGGPGGFLLSAITIGPGPDNNNVIFHTDNTWKFIPIEYKPISICNLSQIGLIDNMDKYFPWGSLNLNSSPSQYVNIGETITGMTGLSFGCWFKSSNNKTWARIFDFGNGSTSDNIAMFINSNTIGCTVYYTNNGGNQLNCTPNINNNQWNHIVWTLSKPNGSNTCNWLIYLNGKLTYNKPGNYPINMSRTKCYIGKSNWDDPMWNGRIANFVMFQKELTGLEVSALYYNMIKSTDPKLYLYLPLALNSVLDTIVNNYAGKIYNLPIVKSKVKNENWNCMPEGKNYINVKLKSNNPMCMSLDGMTCVVGTESECNILSQNPITPENPIICSENQKGWCQDAKKYLMSLDQIKSTQSTILPETKSETIPLSSVKPGTQSLSALDVSANSESINLKPLAGGGKILSIKNMIDVNNLMIGGVFKLRVNLPMMPPYIKGKNFNTTTGTNPNYFYLSVEKLDNNCSIKNTNGTCRNVYADNKKCDIKSLTAYTQNNAYRLVLISSQYALDPSIPFGKNSDFTLVQVNGQLYLKNIQTGYLPSLYSNENNILVYGDMLVNPNSNVNNVEQLIKNDLCNVNPTPTPNPTPNPTPTSKNVRCNIQQDPEIYLMTHNNIGDSSPIKININSDNTININLLSFNKYGYPTKNYALTFCNFNVKTYTYIEKITNTLGTFLINMVCFSDVQDSKIVEKNKLNFVVELISFPQNFIKNNSIYTIA